MHRLNTGISQQRPDLRQDQRQAVALTLDACGGGFDAALIDTLLQHQVAATVFMTARWIRANPEGLKRLLAHPQLFELENHGAAHVPAVIGGKLFGMPGPADEAGVEREIAVGAQAIQQASGRAPRYYRGAGARYDTASLRLIERMKLQVAGYSLNADDGATASAATVARRLKAAQPADVILAHMNKPASGTAEGLAHALPVLLARGLKFVKLSDTAGLVDAPQRAEANASPARTRP